MWDLFTSAEKFWFVCGILYGIATWIANIALCYNLAQKKRRDGSKWAWLAFFFGILPTLILASLRSYTEEEWLSMETKKIHADLSQDEINKF